MTASPILLPRPRGTRIPIAALAALLALGGTAAAAPAPFDCVVDPAQRVKVGSPIAGVLEAVLVRRGDVVRKDQPIARLESRIEEAGVAVDRARAQATEEIDAQETRLSLSRTRLGRAAQLAGKNFVTQERMDELNAEVRIHERTLAFERYKRRLAELELARSEALLDRRTIRSPIDGVVTQRLLGPGEYTSQEAAIVTIVELDPLYVEAFVPVALWGKIREGTPGEVELDAPIGGVHPATVSVVDRVFDAASGTFGVRLELRNPNGTLPAGQRCRLSFPSLGG